MFVCEAWSGAKALSRIEVLCSSVLLRNVTYRFVTVTYMGKITDINPYPTAFPYGNGMVLHFYQQQESSRTKTVHKVINKGLKTYV